MTVAELIAQLKNLPGDMMVVIPGYEGGFDDPNIHSSTLIPNANWDGKDKYHWFNGKHAPYFEMESEGNVQPVACVVVGRS